MTSKEFSWTGDLPENNLSNQPECFCCCNRRASQKRRQSVIECFFPGHPLTRVQHLRPTCDLCVVIRWKMCPSGCLGRELNQRWLCRTKTENRLHFKNHQIIIGFFHPPPSVVSSPLKFFVSTTRIFSQFGSCSRRFYFIVVVVMLSTVAQ